MVRHIQPGSTKLDTTVFLSLDKRLDDGHFSGLFEEARVDAAQQSAWKVDNRMQRNRKEAVHSELPESDTIVSDNELREAPAEEDIVSEEWPPSDRPDNETSNNDREVRDQDERAVEIDAPDSDEDPESGKQEKPIPVRNEVNGSVVQAQKNQQVLLSGLATQTNAKTAQQLASLQNQPQANTQPVNPSSEQADAALIQNQPPEKLNVQLLQQQVNQVLLKQPEQNVPLTQTEIPADTVELNGNDPNVIEVPPHQGSPGGEGALLKPEVDKLPDQAPLEVTVQAGMNKQSEKTILIQNNPALEENDKSNQSRLDLITKRNITDRFVEGTVTYSDPSKQKGFEFTKQNQGRHDVTLTAKSPITASVEKNSDLQNLPEMKSFGQVQTSDAVDMQENVDRIVRAARTVQARGSTRIQIRLEPPELGFLRIEIKHSSNGLNLQLQATNPKAQQILQQNSHELRAALESQGLQPRQIEIQLRLDLRNEHTPNQQQDHYPSSHSGSQGHSQEQGRQESDSEPFLLWQDWQAEREPEDADSKSNPVTQWQSLEFTALDVRV